MIGILALAFLAPAAPADTIIDLGRGPISIHVPPSYDPESPIAMVMLLHGYSSSGLEIENYIQLTALADEFGFLYLHPDGTSDFLGNRFWNATDACCDLFGSGVDDSSYLLDVIDEVKALFNVDDRRVFVAGHSNGGFMSYRMACDHAEVIAAIASLAGATYFDLADCAPLEPVHVLQIHGTADLVIDYDGGFVAGPYPGAVDTTEMWSIYDACPMPPDTSIPPLDLDVTLAGAESLVTRYAAGCLPGGSAELWTIVGGNHTPSLTADFGRQVVEFLLAHPKAAVLPPCQDVQDCADLDGDAIRDDGCVFWGCAEGTCAGTPVTYADMGGPNGACLPDGVADSNDRFHVLNCFSDRDTSGSSGYPCEAVPPVAFNVDVAGLATPCAPDGVCDANDAFAALNVFEGISSCSCSAAGPQPTLGVASAAGASGVGQRTALLLTPSSSRARPGELIDVRVYLAEPLSDLRGYQLHVSASGGRQGHLELVDIALCQPGVFPAVSPLQGAAGVTAAQPGAATRSATRGQPAPSEATAAAGWSAFNTATRQMLVGLDGPGVAAPQGACLASFTFRASGGAAGTFVIDMLQDRSDHGQRTALFPSAVFQEITLHTTTPATVQVEVHSDERP